MVKAFTFPGQGSQVVGMGKEFYDNFSVAKQVFEEVDSTLNRKLSQTIFDGPIDVLTRTDNAQPAIMATSIAVLRVLEQESGQNISQICNFVAGHSLGEYTALCACGALSLSDTTRLLDIRGRSFETASEQNVGSMCALLGGNIMLVMTLLDAVRENEDVNLKIQIANDNTVGQVVISGHEHLIDKAVSIATNFGFKKAVKLNVSGAFHSELMQSAVEEMTDALQNITINTSPINFISNVTAKITNSPEEIKLNLIRQITGAVRWRETLLNFKTNKVDKIVEIGAKTLTPFVSRTIEDGVSALSINSIEVLKAELYDFTI
ncbi:MAG: ACP S-malonyltransferase [Rickettsiales bacterium]|jgi:[acyl-carrier-protein] S-malonyltransferase|nr:ACP S-malonyltransferase [Rickettsiales bacterium]